MTNRGGARRREAALTATAFTLCLVGGVVRVDDTPLSWPPAAVYLIAVVSCAVLPLRHRAPLAVLAATTVCGMFVVPLGLVLTPIVVAPAVVTAYTLAVHTERRTASGALLVSAGLLAGSNLVFGDVSWEHASRTGAVVAFPLVAGVLGRSARNRRAYLAAVEERAWRAEKDRESEARRRVAEERCASRGSCTISWPIRSPWPTRRRRSPPTSSTPARNRPARACVNSSAPPATR
ncbi:hypothetical protein SHKM778_09830 [Streptomyces sp. KM77-8]|uniref:DUF7134 domain-containing protein n=1 Tax=Streptomyces haneummycinicus TaxID=3074435 RepID=A0AAT9HB11_9ACTN